MKKMLKSLFVLALLLVQIVPALAVNAEQANSGSILERTKGKITIDNAIVGQTYKIYQILELESYSTGKAYSYKAASDEWATFIATDAKDYLIANTEGYVSWVGAETDARVAAFAKLALAYAKEKGIEAIDSKQATTTEENVTVTSVTFDELELGYYLVDSSTGALCSLDTTDNEVKIEEKNTVPTVDKTVNENGQYGKENNATIGDTVEFKTEITVGKGAQSYVLHDTMSKGLTLNEDSFVITAKKSDGTVVTVETSDYEIKATPDTGDTFTIVFADEFTTEVGVNGKITVTYTALLNDEAEIAVTPNTNNTNLTYGDNKRVESTPTKTYTYEFDIVKTTSDKTVLNGAEFELYKKLTVENKEVKQVIKVGFVETKDGVNIYRVLDDQNATGVAIAAGVARVEGLDAGTYYLEETKIPDGYNKLADDPKITLTGNNTAKVETNKYKEGGLQVINLTGSELPHTGGMGTVLFIVIGSLMVLGFGVLLVTKLRMSKVAL